jgi:hypothetical protein
MTHWIVTTLKATAVSHFVIQSKWMWPLCETLHFVGLALLVGVVGLLDLRLLGHFRHLSLRAVHALIPWGILGFAINLITGSLFFIGAPEQYLGNVAFYYKLGFLAIAGVNVLVFELTQSWKMATIDAGVDSPRAFKLIGAVSIFSWFMVLYWGRMLPFIGTAF